MTHLPRKNYALQFLTAASPDTVFMTLCRIPESIAGSSLCRYESNAYRVTLPGACVRFRIYYERGRTRLFAQFKSFASSLWQRLKKLLQFFLPLRPAHPGAPTPKTKDIPTKSRAQSVADIVYECQSNESMQGRLVFTNKALALAEACSFRHIHQLGPVMQKLTMAVGLIRGGLHVGMSAKDFWEREIGLPVTLQLSATQEQKFGAHYDALHDDKVIRGRWHITLGHGHSPADCMSIHFALCDDCQALIITRFGAHGPTSRS